MRAKYLEVEGYLISLTSTNGIVKSKYSDNYLVNIELKTKTKCLGATKTLEEAVRLYLEAVKRYRGAKVMKVLFEQMKLF